MLGISWFDIVFFVLVVLCEIHWYVKGKNDDRAFLEFQTEISDSLCEISQRLDEAIGPVTDEDVEKDFDANERYVETVQKSKN